MHRRHAAVALAAGLAVSSSALGQSKMWDGGAGSADWFAGLNWDPDGVPGAGDAVLVQGAVPVAQAADIDVRSLIVDTGLVLDSRSLILAEPSTITNFTLQGCCTRSITTQGLLTLQGTTSLLKGTEFKGAGGARISGMATSAEIVKVNGTVLTIAGTLIASGDVQPWSGGSVDVTGSLALRATADLDEVNGGATRLLPGGRIGHLGTTANDQSLLDARLEAGAGLLYADRGILDLRGEYDLEFTTIETTDGGQVWLTGSFPNEIDGVRFEGDGTVELRNANNTYVGALEAAVAGAGSLDVYGTMRLDGLLSVTGNMGLRSATVTSPAGTGAIGVDGRVVSIGTPRMQVPLSVFAGGVLEIPSGGLTLGADLTIDTGGEVLMPGDAGGSSISKPSSGGVGSVYVHGRLAASRTDGNPCNLQLHTVGVPVELRPGGVVEALDGEFRLVGGGSWTGGVLRAAALCQGRLVIGGSGVTHFVAGDVTVRAEDDGEVLLGEAGHTLNVIGTLRIEDLGTGSFSGITLQGTSIGPGEIRHEQGELGLFGSCDLGCDLINSAHVGILSNTVLRGVLRNDVEVTQQGALRFEGGAAENTGNWFVFNALGDQTIGSGGLFTNTGVYRVGYPGAGGFTNDVAVRFDNQGSVTVEDAHAVFRDVVQMVNGALTGGDWDVLTTGSITFPGVQVDRVTGQGTRVRGDRTTQPWVAGVGRIDGGANLESAGGWDFNTALTLEDATLDAVSGTLTAPKIDVEGTGTLGVGDGARVESGGNLDLHSVTSDIQGVIVPGLLPAPATIQAPEVLSHGRIIPGGEGRAGQFDFLGNLTVFDGGEVVVDIGGEDNTDVITVTGAVTLGGTLRVGFIDEFTPIGGESYRLIDTMNGVFGAFTAVELPELPSGLEWEVYIGEVFVGLSVLGGSCEADWDGNGTVNTVDFLAYLNDWSAGDPEADINNDGTVNTIDFLMFLNLWTAGC